MNVFEMVGSLDMVLSVLLLGVRGHPAQVICPVTVGLPRGTGTGSQVEQ